MIYLIKYNGADLSSEDGHEWKAVSIRADLDAKMLNISISVQRQAGSHHDPIQLTLSKISGITWLSQQPDESSDDLVQGEINSNSSAAPQPLSKALAADLQPLGDALFGAIQAGDLSAMKAGLREISKRMPEFMESAAVADALGEEMMAELETIFNEA